MYMTEAKSRVVVGFSFGWEDELHDNPNMLAILQMPSLPLAA